jgi:glutamine synthetase
MNVLLENLSKMNAVMEQVTALKESAQGQLFSEINNYVQDLKISVDNMTQARKAANKLASSSDRAHAYAFEVKPLFEVIRSNSDQLEKLMSDSHWPLLKYRELLQIR